MELPNPSRENKFSGTNRDREISIFLGQVTMRRCGGVGQQEQWEDSLATQPDREIELSQTNRVVGVVCVGVTSRPIKVA